MEPYKVKKLPFDFNYERDLLTLICDAEEAFGEYKGFLKSMSFDYTSFLETNFVSDLYYSFILDGSKIDKQYMFHSEYMKKNNDYTQIINMKKSLLLATSDITNKNYSLETINKINKTLFSNCTKMNKTKGSGKYRKSQTYLLKPGIAGSSISFIPPVYTDITPSMKNLMEYTESNNDVSMISTLLLHYQFEKIHPYVSGNGKIGRLLIPINFSYFRKEPPVLFISEILNSQKNTYFSYLSGEISEDVYGYLKFMLKCIVDQCNLNIKKIRKLNKIYKKDLEEFNKVIGGTTIKKVYPVILKKIVFTTNDLVKECGLHINSVNKVLNKLTAEGYLIKEKKKDSNRVTFCYKNFYDVYVS